MTSNLKRWLAGAGVVLGLLPALAQAQQATTVSGRVTTDVGQPLQGASVSIPALGVGAYTQADGRYSFTVPAARTGQAVVTARRIGYTPKSETVTLGGGPVSQDFVLTAAATQLTGVVVTALGVEREKSQLGTAQQQITASQLTQAPTQNILNQISGKASGVQITGSGTQGGSTNIIIRGQNSITGSNQPLFVVDGIPMSNRDIGGDPDGGSGTGGGYDFGSAIADLNPEDIESLNILKGPNAAALYGSRAANGVIVITTKKGRNTNGRIQTQITTSLTFDRPSILPDYQNQYGQGAGGDFMFVNGAGKGINDNLDQSFGPKLDGRLIHQFTDGADTTVKSPWVAHPNNVESFFNTGKTLNSTLAVSGGTDKANARLSVGAENVDGMIPDNYFRKFNAALSGNLQLSSRLSTSATIDYIRNNGQNRPGVGYNTGILESFVWFGRQVDMNALRNNYAKSGSINGGPSYREYNWNYNYHNNPFWIQYENPENDTRDRFTGNVSATYRVFDWLNGTLRTGSDIYRYNIDQNWAEGNLNFTNPAYNGAFSFANSYNNENNTELLFTANKQATSRLTLNGTAGANRRYEQYTFNSQSTSGILAPGTYNVSNAGITPTLSQRMERRQVNSVYGSASFTWDGWWTLEGTARNDWSSTLPKGNNSYFYPSVNTSIVLTDALPFIKNDVLTYAKIRGSVAKVGSDASVYSLITPYQGISAKFSGLPQFTLADALANSALKPEITRSSEAGLELSFFDDRATLDATYYAKTTTNQVIQLAVAPSSGFSSRWTNAGRIDNKGFEALLNVTPVRLSNGFEWNTGFNYSQNHSKVVSLFPDVKTIVLGSSWYTNIEARVGEPYGSIFGYPFARDAQGNLETSGGKTLPGSRKVLGNIQPSWTGGWSNSISYKGFTANALLDFHVGGDIVSITNFFGDYAGITKASLKGREADWNSPGVLVKGTDADTGDPNTTTVTAEQYFQNIFPVMEPYVYKATWVKLRELRIGYDLPSRLAGKVYATNVNIALIGRNLWTSTDVPNIDPEFSYSAGNQQGIEFAALPNPRSIGFSIRVTP